MSPVAADQIVADAAAGIPPAAAAVFGARLPHAVRYAQLLATAGVERGLIGPREVPRLWERHLMNSAALAGGIGHGLRVIDVGSGAGLPGIPLALARPDLTVVLVEPMVRRTTFLLEVVAELGLSSSVSVVRGRAPEVGAVTGMAPVVLARALAPLDRLVGWCLPLAEPGGVVLAMKGARAADELAAYPAERWSRGVDSAELTSIGGEAGSATVIVVRRAAPRSSKRTR